MRVQARVLPALRLGGAGPTPAGRWPKAVPGPTRLGGRPTRQGQAVPPRAEPLPTVGGQLPVAVAPPTAQVDLLDEAKRRVNLELSKRLHDGSTYVISSEVDAASR